MKVLILITAIGLLSFSATQGQIKNAKTETIKVYGNCDLCKTAIEKAGNKAKLYKTEWNVDTKIAAITYDSKQTNRDAVLKSIALLGYDNQNYLAPDDAYSKLPACCKYKREKKTMVKSDNAPMPDATNYASHNNGNSITDTQKLSQLKAVYDGYFSLKDALVKTDGGAASANAAAMLAAIDAVDMSKLGAEEHTAWMAAEKKLKSDAQHIKENKDPEHQREHFITLSKTIYDLIKAAKPDETVYYQFCPMANDGKGANWLSKESAIKNPYYGSKMLSCGKTVETIKP
jgi:copper chaperone CopZ